MISHYYVNPYHAIPPFSKFYGTFVVVMLIIKRVVNDAERKWFNYHLPTNSHATGIEIRKNNFNTEAPFPLTFLGNSIPPIIELALSLFTCGHQISGTGATGLPGDNSFNTFCCEYASVLGIRDTWPYAFT